MKYVFGAASLHQNSKQLLVLGCEQCADGIGVDVKGVKKAAPAHLLPSRGCRALAPKKTFAFKTAKMAVDACRASY